MTDPVFVDTNVFVYARDARDSVKQARASEWLSALWHEQSGRTSTQVLSEYYVTVTRKLSPGLPDDDAWDDVEALLAWRPIASDDVLLSRGHDIVRRFRLGWWDSLIVAAAQLQGCSLLLSEDLQDGGVYGGVTVRSPFTLSVGEEAVRYRSQPKARRYRQRGRPKR
jgi:predicted nucleic acid-binding protein